MRPWVKKTISLAVSALILGAIYGKLGRGALLEVLAKTKLGWLLAAIALVVPITLGSAWRFVRVIPRGRGVSVGESTRLVLASSALNMVLPSKLGDLAKAVFLQEKGELRGPVPLAAVLFEKAADLFALLVCCTVGLAFVPDKSKVILILFAGIALGLGTLGLVLVSRGFARGAFEFLQRFGPLRVRSALRSLEAAWSSLLEELWGRGGAGPTVLAGSVVLWWVHILQIWLFARALGGAVPFLATAGLSPLAILAGLLPFTLAGIGTRDAALVYFFSPYLPAELAAALGILTTLRYLLPAVVGLPFLGPYANRARLWMRREGSK